MKICGSFLVKEPMDLKDFVTKTLVDIVASVDDVRTQSGKVVHLMKPSKGAQRASVEFDIAVTAEKTRGKKEWHVKVLDFELSGKKGADVRSETISHVRFGVDVAG